MRITKEKHLWKEQTLRGGEGRNVTRWGGYDKVPFKKKYS